MSEELKPELAPIEEKMTQELVKANVTEAVIASIREKYLPLKIAGLDDKETYLLVKEGRKECKSLRVMAKKICTNGREEATAIQKAWIAKEKEVTGRIAEVEDYLEAQEKEYEAGIAAEKEARKRKEEEQLIIRQQILTNMGALYSDGCFVLGDVSFELSAIKESDLDVWNDVINAAFLAEYQKIQAEEIEKARLQQEREAELKRQQEELERKQKELSDKEAELKKEADRQAAEAQAKKDAQIKARQSQIAALGFKYNGSVEYHFHEYTIIHEDIIDCNDDEWNREIKDATEYVTQIRESEAEEKRKEQERIDLQNKRYAELLPYKECIASVKMDELFLLSEDQFSTIVLSGQAEKNRIEEEKAKEIAEKAAKAERERIEEEQRQAEAKRKEDLRKSRIAVLNEHCLTYFNENGHLENMTEDEWLKVFRKLINERDEITRKQEEERKAEELAQASDKVKWADIIKSLQELEIHDFRSGQYRKKAAILREKLEEIKAL